MTSHRGTMRGPGNGRRWALAWLVALLLLAAPSSCGPTCRPEPIRTVRDPCLPRTARAGAPLTLRWIEACASPCTQPVCRARVVGVAIEVEVLSDGCASEECIDVCEVDALRSCTIGPFPEGTYDLYVSGSRAGRVSLTADGATSC